MKTTLSPFTLLIAVFAIVAVPLVSPVQAVLIAEQEYNGSTFGFNNPFNNGTLQPGLTYSTLTVSGSSRNFSDSPVTGFTGGPLSNNSTYFISFLLDTTGNLGGRTGLTLFANFAQDGNGNGSGTEVAEFGQNNGFVNILTGNYGTPPAFQNIASGVATTNGTHLYVIGVNTNSGSDSSTLSLYYDPTSSIAPAPLLTYSVGVPAFHLNNIRAYQSGTWDEFRVGATFADVTPGLPVPEPASLALLGLGMGFVLLRKRTRVS